MVDAIILAGGKGSRMGDALPKPLMPVNNTTILGYQIEYLMQSGCVEHIIITLGHGAEQVEQYIKEHFSSYPILFSREERLLGTGGGLRQAMELSVSEKVLVINCDDITDISLATLMQVTEHTVCVAHPRLPFGLVKEEQGYARFEEKPMLADWTSCGWYIFFRDDLFPLLPQEGSLEYDVFPKIKMRLYKHEGIWKPLNTKKDLLEYNTPVQ